MNTWNTKPAKPGKPAVDPIDPRTLDQTEPVTFEEVQEGDFLRAGSWSRPRRVEVVEHYDGGRVLFLAEPDATRTYRPGIRKVTEMDWNDRYSWHRLPVLRELYDRAHGC